MNLGGWMDRNDAAGRSEGTRERVGREERERACVRVRVRVQRRDVWFTCTLVLEYTMFVCVFVFVTKSMCIQIGIFALLL